MKNRVDVVILILGREFWRRSGEWVTWVGGGGQDGLELEGPVWKLLQSFR